MSDTRVTSHLVGGTHLTIDLKAGAFPLQNIGMPEAGRSVSQTQVLETSMTAMRTVRH